MTRLVRLGALGKGIAAGNSLGMAPDNNSTRAKLRVLHLKRSEPVDSPVLAHDRMPDPVQATQDAVKATILTFPRSSSGGPTVYPRTTSRFYSRSPPMGSARLRRCHGCSPT